MSNHFGILQAKIRIKSIGLRPVSFYAKHNMHKYTYLSVYILLFMEKMNNYTNWAEKAHKRGKKVREPRKKERERFQNLSLSFSNLSVWLANHSDQAKKTAESHRSETPFSLQNYTLKCQNFSESEYSFFISIFRWGNPQDDVGKTNDKQQIKGHPYAAAKKYGACLKADSISMLEDTPVYAWR